MNKKEAKDSLGETSHPKAYGLRNLGGGADTNLPDSARQPLGEFGAMLPRKILKNRVSLMPFPAFWCEFLLMEQVTNEKKILRILVKLSRTLPPEL